MKRITFFSILASIGTICFLVIFTDCNKCFSFSAMALKFSICGLVIIITGIYFTREFFKVENIIFRIESQPLLETDEATDGVPFAGEGVVVNEGDRILKSFYTRTPCVYFHSIEEKYISGEADYWEIVENIARFIPFYIKDRRGKLKIDLTNLDTDFSGYRIPLEKTGTPDPKNSEIDCDVVLKHQPYYPPGETKKGFLSSFFIGARSKYRISEFVLKPGTKVFVYGMVFKKNNQLILGEDKKHPLIISKKNRDQYVEEFYRGRNLVYIIHFLVALGFTIVFLAINYFLKLNPINLLIILFAGNSIIIGSIIFSIYNRIITLKNRALNALSNIDIELKRRSDLISNMVEVVKDYVKHEEEIQKIIVEGREKIAFSTTLKEEEKPIINSLTAIIENYPNLKASDNFHSLVKILIDTEERIAYVREFYNRSVRKYNTLINQIPFLFISSILGMKEMKFINITQGEGNER